MNNLLQDINPDEQLFIVGDLNMDLKSNKGLNLLEWNNNNAFTNEVHAHTRICTGFYEKTQSFKTKNIYLFTHFILINFKIKCLLIVY